MPNATPAEITAPLPGQSWNPALHGVVVTTSREASALYDRYGIWFGRFCEDAGVPTGVPVPVQVRSLMEKAFELRALPWGWNETARRARQAELVAEALLLMGQGAKSEAA